MPRGSIGIRAEEFVSFQNRSMNLRGRIFLFGVRPGGQFALYDVPRHGHYPCDSSRAFPPGN